VSSTTQTTTRTKEQLDRKIRNVTEGLTQGYYRYFTKLSDDDALVIANYILSVKSETNMSDNYRKILIKLLSRLSIFSHKLFREITRDDILSFLDSYRKPESVDPMHKWIGTYNFYNTTLTRFFKWLLYPDIPPKDRPKPPAVENIGRLKRREVSIYKPTDLWTEEDDSLFLKYCPSKRIKCYHMVSRDTSCRPHEILKLKVRDIVFKKSGSYQYAEVLVNGKTGSRNIPLINSIPYVKDYLDHEHPQPRNPNAPFICGIGKSLGRSIEVISLYMIYDNYKKEYFPKLLNSPNVAPEDKLKVKELLKKPWNPYVRRHTGLTEKAKILKEPILKMHAGWSPRSMTHLKYEHWFGNESTEGILEAYGIVPKDKQLSDILKPKQCPNCSEPNKPDSKFCAKCRMVLAYDAYNETLEKQQERESEVKHLQEKYEQDMKAMREEMENKFQQILTKIDTGKLA
jgi:integrase/recombinase XerD